MPGGNPRNLRWPLTSTCPKILPWWVVRSCFLYLLSSWYECTDSVVNCGFYEWTWQALYSLQAPAFHHVFVMIMWPNTAPPLKNNMVVISNGTTTMLCGIELHSFWSIYQNTKCIPQSLQYLSFVTHSYWSPHDSTDSSSYTVLKSLAHRYN